MRIRIRLATCFQAGTPIKDVILPDDSSKKSLLLSKHADYIAAFDKDKDDYVCRCGVGVV